MSQHSDESEHKHIVMDNGSLFTRIGYAGYTKPEHIFETIIGEKTIDDKHKIWIGEQLKSKHDQDIKLTYPIHSCRQIQNFDKMEKIWHHSFYKELKVAPEEHKVLLTEPVFNNKAHREKITQIMFETFNVPAMYLNNQATLSLFASGRTTGIVVDSGYDTTQFVPIYEGYALSPSNTSIGGKHVTENLQTLIKNKNEKLCNALHLEDIRIIKEKYGYIAEDGAEIEMKKPICGRAEWLITGYLRHIDKKYDDYTSVEIENICDKYCGDKSKLVRERNEFKLPDGQVIELVGEEFNCTECMDGFHELLWRQVLTCDVDIRKDLLMNIVLAGGNSLLKGFKEKLEKVMVVTCRNSICYKKCKVKVIAPQNRGYSTWLGGSILTSLSTFSEMWIENTEYSSAGPSIVHRKCY